MSLERARAFDAEATRVGYFTRRRSSLGRIARGRFLVILEKSRGVRGGGGVVDLGRIVRWGPSAGVLCTPKGLWILVYAGACQGTAWAGFCLIRTRRLRSETKQTRPDCCKVFMPLGR